VVAFGGACTFNSPLRMKERQSRLGRERFSRRREPHSAMVSFKELYPEILFELPDLSAERRLCDVKFDRRARKIQLFGDSGNIAIQP
jgi:hypothetical protein